MMSASETRTLVAKGLTYQANGEVRKMETNRQIVAINNFIWQADRVMVQRDHAGAQKMVNKAANVVMRMEEAPEDLAGPAELCKREVRIRQQLLRDRERLIPLIATDRPLAPLHEFHLKVIDGQSSPHFADLLECILYVRSEVFHEALGVPLNVEHDERDEMSRHFVLYLGDAIVACARIWFQDGHTYVLDRMLVVPEYRGRGLASRLLASIIDEVRANNMKRLIISFRNDPTDSESQRTSVRLRNKLLQAGICKVAQDNLFLVHAGVAGQLGMGVHVTLLDYVL